MGPGIPVSILGQVSLNICQEFVWIVPGHLPVSECQDYKITKFLLTTQRSKLISFPGQTGITLLTVLFVAIGVVHMIRKNKQLFSNLVFLKNMYVQQGVVWRVLQKKVSLIIFSFVDYPMSFLSLFNSKSTLGGTWGFYLDLLLPLTTQTF